MIQVVGLAAGSQCLTERLCVLGQEATVCQPARGKTHTALQCPPDTVSRGKLPLVGRRVGLWYMALRKAGGLTHSMPQIAERHRAGVGERERQK
jgi:hypothetical protein